MKRTLLMLIAVFVVFAVTTHARAAERELGPHMLFPQQTPTWWSHVSPGQQPGNGSTGTAKPSGPQHITAQADSCVSCYLTRVVIDYFGEDAASLETIVKNDACLAKYCWS